MEVVGGGRGGGIIYRCFDVAGTLYKAKNTSNCHLHTGTPLPCLCVTSSV